MPIRIRQPSALELRDYGLHFMHFANHVIAVDPMPAVMIVLRSAAKEPRPASGKHLPSDEMVNPPLYRECETAEQFPLRTPTGFMPIVQDRPSKRFV